MTPAPEIGPFDEVLDVVEEGSCDPEGGTSCTGPLDRAVEAGRLLVFPPGRYRFDEPLAIDVDGRVGLVGRGDVRLVPPRGFNGMLLQVDAAEFLLQGVDVDLTAPNTTAGVTVGCDDRFVVEGVEYLGRGVHEAGSLPFACNVSVRSPSGRGVVRDLRALRGSAIGHYKGAGGRGGIWVGQRNEGTVRIEDCHLEEFGNNGIYASRTPGNVEVVGGVYRNNNASNVRIGGEGSVARGVTVEVDFAKYDGPETGLDSEFTTRGVVVEQGPRSGIKPPGAEILDSEILMRRSPFGGTAVSAWSTARTVAVRRTHVRTDIDGFPAVFRAPTVPLGDQDASEPPRHLHLDDVRIDGSADGGSAVQVLDAPNTRIRDTHVRQSGADRDGISFARSDGSVVDGGSVRVPGRPLVVAYGEHDDGCLVELRNDPRLARTDEGETPPSAAGFDRLATDCLPVEDLPDSATGGHVEVVTADGETFYRVVGSE